MALLAETKFRLLAPYVTSFLFLVVDGFTGLLLLALDVKVLSIYGFTTLFLCPSGFIVLTAPFSLACVSMFVTSSSLLLSSGSFMFLAAATNVLYVLLVLSKD